MRSRGTSNRRCNRRRRVANVVLVADVAVCVASAPVSGTEVEPDGWRIVVRRPPNPPGTPRWERCEVCGELIRVDQDGREDPIREPS
jgi:hypothetical protein